MYEHMPEPLPKCFCPESREMPDGSRRTVAFVSAMSPPLPGSDVIVPHQSPSRAQPNTCFLCSSHAPSYGAGARGVVSHSERTAGCIDDTRATDESPWASARSSSHRGRVVLAVFSHMPPI